MLTNEENAYVYQRGYQSIYWWIPVRNSNLSIMPKHQLPLCSNNKLICI